MTAELSVVVPLNNQERMLPTLHLRLTATLRQMAIPYEILYIENGSTDSTPSLISELCDQDNEVKALFLSRHFEHQSALCAGLEASTGRAVVSLDGGLLDPPEMIPKLVHEWNEGHQIVYARPRRGKGYLHKRAAQAILSRLLRRISGLSIPLDTSDYVLMDRETINHLNALPERQRNIQGMRTWLGFKQTEVVYDRDSRYDNGTSGSIRRIMRVASESLYAFSERPLKAIMSVGMLTVLAAIALTVLQFTGLLGAHFANQSALVLISSGIGLLGGVQLVGMGIIAEYIGRIYHDVRGRPFYLVHHRKGFEPFPRVVPNVLDFIPRETTDLQELATTQRMGAVWSDVRTESGTGK